ncbi:MAG: hypothetical protein JXB38_15405 [Anaerolineales bacterium]|nr:hypothetical protein [Anaerolineales bacterium]
MFNKISNSWELLKASAKVLQADKELLIFPIISAVGVLLVTATFFIPMLVTDFLGAFTSSNIPFLNYFVVFLYYIVQYTVIFFANTALVGAAIIRLKGGDPTLADGFRVASQRFVPILGYALIAATVGLVLKAISDRSKSLGRFIISLIGLAWNIATYLVVPILAVEEVGPIDAIKRSVSLLKQTWGEQIVGNFSINTIFGLISMGIVLIGFTFGAAVIMLELSWVLLIIIGALLVLTLVLIGLISSTLNGIYTAAVYQYATTGEAGEFFNPDLVQNAFRLR